MQIPRLPRSTVSDTNKLVDPTLLQPLLDDLAQRVPGATLPHELDVLVKRLVALDGTFLRIVGELAWTLRQHTANGRCVSKPRLDVQLDVAAGVPRFAVLSGRDRSECNAARLHIEAGKIYVADKAYFGFDLLRDWLARQRRARRGAASKPRVAPRRRPPRTAHGGLRQTGPLPNPSPPPAPPEQMMLPLPLKSRTKSRTVLPVKKRFF